VSTRREIEDTRDAALARHIDQMPAAAARVFWPLSREAREGIERRVANGRRWLAKQQAPPAEE
jgi:hypothetical protein